LTNKNHGRKLACSAVANAICGHPNYGPTFGGYDIRIESGGEKGDQLFTEFPTHYNDNVGAKGQLTYAMMTGDFEKQKCRIIDYEVFKLIYEEDLARERA
jgi:hypothetical protein